MYKSVNANINPKNVIIHSDYVTVLSDRIVNDSVSVVDNSVSVVITFQASHSQELPWSVADAE